MTGTLMMSLAAGATLLVGTVLILLRAVARQDRFAERVLVVQRAAGTDRVGSDLRARTVLLRFVGGIGGVLTRSGLLSAKTVAELEQTLSAGGFRGDRALAIFVGAKVLLLVGLPLASFGLLHLLGTTGTTRNLVLGVSLILGMLAPDMFAKRLRKKYLAAVERGLPDALDMMVICAEAGLGLETAIERVALEIRPAHPEVSNEFFLTATEMRILSDRRQALINMGERTGVETLARLASTLAQSLQYGTPLIQALRTLSAEMRQDQLIRFEARAARLPVLLTLPMILFILPTIFLVVAGPAALTVFRAR